MNKLPNINSLFEIDLTSNDVLTIAPISFDKNVTQRVIFQKLADKPWSIWLDSCESEHCDSRFDIIVWSPTITLETSDEITKINYITNSGQQTTINSAIDPLLLVKHCQQQLFQTITLPSEPSDFDLLPFKGGAVGYFGYDLGRRFETLPSQAKKDINAADMAVGIYTKALLYDRHLKQHYLLCPQNARATIEHWLNEENTSTTKKNFSLTSPWQANMTKADYCNKFEQVQTYLTEGDCYQINLSQRFSANYTGDEFQAYLALRETNKAPFSAFIRLEKQTIISVSPERFLKLKQGKVQSKPIKGTRPRSENHEQDKKNAIDLQNATKDRAENLMIVDLLRNDISRVCVAGSVKVPSLFAIESFPAVHHLVSTVEGELSTTFDGTDLLRSSFPGGSITGAPKIRAMEIIEELEPHRRSVYCGSIGYLSACGNMDTSITIRTLITENNQLYCWAGGGLVADSNAESEYQETFDKVQKILPVLAEFCNK